MKITGYRCLRSQHDWGRPVGDANGVIDSGITEVPILILETDEGVEGIATGSVHDVDRLFPALEGEDPRAVTALYDRMLAQVFKSGPAGATFGGIGTLDAALWDLKAKLAGEPLWRLLGARDRFVPGYASGLDIALDDEQLAGFYRAMAERGFTSGKLKGGRDAAADIRRLGIVADALRINTPNPALMLDANELWNLKQAVRHVSAVETVHDLTWIEEPLRRWDAAGHARLSGLIRAAVATGENLTGLDQFAPLFAAHAVDIVQAGAVWGITHFLRVAMAAHSRDLPISPVGLTANAAVAAAAAAIPNHLSAEVQDVGAPFGITLDQTFSDGGIVLGDLPGAGISIDEAAISQLASEPGTWLAPGGPHVRSRRAGLRMVSNDGDSR
ncbi:mandelate racemase/muconate lactonizing enzyme family protein [Microbacterium sp. RURRCA19A]|uniref:mandelate racemase/muconate lactonizing enzyme family protein n=1 Tax=Microbacterium sp. RURRCA19A TaxID=1907391 RepID=UPI0009545234|nr:mandelate racemase/muconate lactonizing enzyme family protein [Microbacterium sp. RURRCA19A]SIS20026.1 L-alanine-DL-glutamate epimerase [Microbacterium sp. RURRCA19A]